MISPSYIHFPKLAVTGLLLMLLGACSVLERTQTPQPALYSLDGPSSGVAGATPSSASLSIAAPTLIVNPPHAAAGFDSQRIIYVRKPQQLEYFAQNEWIDTPARMIAPRIVSALENSGSFGAVVLAPSAAVGDLRLDIEILRLQHEFASAPPSRVRFSLRAHLLDSQTRQVLAWREFDDTVSATQDTPYGGVKAANEAVRNVLERLADFCTTAVNDWRSPARKRPQTGE